MQHLTPMSLSSETQGERVRRVLKLARDALAKAPYQREFIAMHRGRSVSPKVRDAALSYRGAILRVCRASSESDEVIAWLNYHHLLPQIEPRTKELALNWFDRALILSGREEDVLV